MTKRITVPYFPEGIKMTSPFLAAGGIYLIVIHQPVWGLLLILTGIAVWTTRYITAIDLQKKKCSDYLFMLGLQLNKDEKTFRSVDRIVVTKSNFSKVMRSRVQETNLKWTEYTGTLILDNDSLDLVTKNNKGELLKVLKEFSAFLKVDVEDRTTPQHFWVDMEQV